MKKKKDSRNGGTIITLESRQKAVKIQGMCFHIADLDSNSYFEEDIRNYIKAHLRGKF